jgi:hypothetical protein
MKTRSLFLLLFLAIILPVNCNAQFGALKRAINKQIDHKIDSTVNKTAQDKAKEQEQANQTGQNGGTKETGRGLFGGKIDIKYNDEYKFTGRIYMQMESYDKKDIKKADYYTYFNGTSKSAGIEVKAVDTNEGEKTQPVVFLFDGENRCFIMLMESNDSKTGIISTIPSDSVIAAKTKNLKSETKEKTEAPEADPITITKTGNTRVIAGYKCDEYKLVDANKEGYALVWMTKDVKLNADRRYWGKAGMPTYNYAGFEGAMMLAMESFDKNDKPEMKMETKDISENFNHSISTTGYTFMKMNFGQAGKK